MQYELQIFEYEDHTEFRIIDIDGEPWFVLADVCRRLDLRPHNDSYSKHAEGLDPDEKRLVARSIINQRPSPLKGQGLPAPIGASLLCINESGLYSLVLASRKPEAKRFKKWVTSEVLPSIRRTGKYGGSTAAFIRRYNENWDHVDGGHFSVISELVWWLWGRLSHLGHIMADKAPDGRELRPDVSVGRYFADYLREEHPDLADTHKMYMHKTPEGEFEARQYPDDLLPIFRRFVDTVWIPLYSRSYFLSRDPAALPYLPHLLPAPAGAKSFPRRPISLPRPPRAPDVPPSANPDTIKRRRI